MMEPVALAISLAEKITRTMLSTRGLPSGNEVGDTLKNLGLEELCLRGGVGVYRSRDLIALAIPRESLIIDVISSSGDLSDAVEIVAYRDKKLNALILEILPANDIEYEGNIGLEPVIIDAETGELLSNPVLGEVIEEEEGMVLVIDGETYERWSKSGKLDTCPVCGGELRWKNDRALCLDCGYEIKVVKK